MCVEQCLPRADGVPLRGPRMVASVYVSILDTIYLLSFQDHDQTWHKVTQNYMLGDVPQYGAGQKLAKAMYQ